MNYRCPRDHTSLTWKDLVNTGRWLCRTCQGTLVSGEAFAKFPKAQEFLALLRAAAPADAAATVTCPACRNGMGAHKFQLKDRFVEVDHCRDCGHLWFDPGELPLLRQAPDRPRPTVYGRELFEVTTTILDEIQPAIDRHMRAKELTARRWSRGVRVFMIVVSAILVAGTMRFAGEYGGKAGRSFNPAGEAIVSLLLSLIFALRPAWFALLLPLIGLSWFKAGMVWLSRL